MSRYPNYDEEESTVGSRSTRCSDRSTIYTTGTYDAREERFRQERLKAFMVHYNQKSKWKKYGRLMALCRETFLISPVNLWWWLTQIFVIITVVVFTYEFFFLNWIIIVPAIILALLEWMAFYKTCLKNPGAMPRQDFVTASKNLITIMKTWEGGNVYRHIDNATTGARENLLFCWRCCHFRATTTIHCPTCDCCMIQQDHHCPVFGGCVAKNNLNSFHTMVISMGCFWLYVMGYCIFNVATTTESYVRTKLKDSDFHSATRETFYLILAEIAIVLILPIMKNCTKELCSKTIKSRRVKAPKYSDIELHEEILQFARDNNFPDGDIQILRDIFKNETHHHTHSLAPNDVLNHNHYYKSPEVVNVV